MIGKIHSNIFLNENYFHAVLLLPSQDIFCAKNMAFNPLVTAVLVLIIVHQ